MHNAKNIFKKSFGIILITLTVLLLSSCGSNKAEPQQPINVKFENSSITSVIYNTKTNVSVSINEKSQCKALQPLGFSHFDSYYYDLGEIARKDLEAGEKTVRLLENDTPDQVFFVGLLNESDKTIKTEDATLFYIEYSGSPNISFFGITTGMTKEEVISLHGEPDAIGGEEGKATALEYYFTRDDCSYGIIAMLDEDGKTYSISVNMGNISIE